MVNTMIEINVKDTVGVIQVVRRMGRVNCLPIQVLKRLVPTECISQVESSFPS